MSNINTLEGNINVIDSYYWIVPFSETFDW